jgi:hypothetical protein
MPGCETCSENRTRRCRSADAEFMDVGFANDVSGAQEQSPLPLGEGELVLRPSPHPDSLPEGEGEPASLAAHADPKR